jgi:CO dehydrogenase maturation factor
MGLSEFTIVHTKGQAMAKTIIVTGRGGTGKTVFSALCSRFLPPPKLLVDADPDQCLGQMLGADLVASGCRSVSEILHQIQKGDIEGGLDSLPLSEQVEYLLHYDCLHEAEDFDLLTIGVKWTPGCYCAPNNILRGVIPRLAESYRYAILDSPAGLEHLNRRVLRRADDIFAVMGPSAKSVRNVRMVREMGEEVGFKFNNLYLVANHRCSDQHLDRMKSIEGTKLVGRMQADPIVQEADWEGRSLMEVPADSPACCSVRSILREAGYEIRTEEKVPNPS